MPSDTEGHTTMQTTTKRAGGKPAIHRLIVSRSSLFPIKLSFLYQVQNLIHLIFTFTEKNRLFVPFCLNWGIKPAGLCLALPAAIVLIYVFGFTVDKPRDKDILISFFIWKTETKRLSCHPSWPQLDHWWAAVLFGLIQTLYLPPAGISYEWS